jgi:hypothetical protein
VLWRWKWIMDGFFSSCRRNWARIQSKDVKGEWLVRREWFVGFVDELNRKSEMEPLPAKRSRSFGGGRQSTITISQAPSICILSAGELGSGRARRSFDSIRINQLTRRWRYIHAFLCPLSGTFHHHCNFCSLTFVK